METTLLHNGSVAREDDHAYLSHHHQQQQSQPQQRGRRPMHTFSKPRPRQPSSYYPQQQQHGDHAQPKQYMTSSSTAAPSYSYSNKGSHRSGGGKHAAFNTRRPSSSSDPAYEDAEQYHHAHHHAHGADEADEELDLNPLQNGFSFRRRRGRLDWRMLAGIDVSKVVRDVDVQTLQDVLENITFAAVDNEDLSYYPETNFVKVFSLAQLIIEYMLHSQAYLASRRSAIERKTVLASSEAKRLMGELQQALDAADALRKENRQLKKTVYAYQFCAKLPGGLSQNDANYNVLSIICTVDLTNDSSSS